MNARTRTAYFALWTRVCHVQGWERMGRAELEERRRSLTAEVMQQVGAAPTESTTRLGSAEITALFTCLQHLADPDNLTKAKLWTDCQADYIAFNKSRQADWHERRAYPRGGGKLDRQRFAGRDAAVQDDFSRPLTRAEAEQRLMTTRARANARAGRLARPEPADNEEIPDAAPEPVHAVVSEGDPF
jgi:hypothetical protein